MLPTGLDPYHPRRLVYLPRPPHRPAPKGMSQGTIALVVLSIVLPILILLTIAAIAGSHSRPSAADRVASYAHHPLPGNVRSLYVRYSACL